MTIWVVSNKQRNVLLFSFMITQLSVLGVALTAVMAPYGSYGTLCQLWHVMAVMAHYGSYGTLLQLRHIMARYGSYGTLGS